MNWSAAGDILRNESPTPIGGGTRPPTGRTIRTLEDLHAAVAHYVKSIPHDKVISTATHVSTDIDFRFVSESEIEEALTRRAEAGPRERDIYASYVNNAFLSALEARTVTGSSTSSVSAPSPCPTKRGADCRRKPLLRWPRSSVSILSCAFSAFWLVEVRTSHFALWYESFRT